ncbi:MAG: hypothetical protein KGN36_08525 [Acidobacteriota bacterium]|nr:hypothetical protein [Acidobacteriota bacterium]
MRLFLTVALLLCGLAAARAQGNYEVQVYGSDLVPKGATMVEIHSNYTASGSPGGDGVLPTNHAEHETLEITRGLSQWFECGLYQFTSIQPDGSWQWVGTHIRPRVAIPESYHLPVGLSLSLEVGYQRPNFSPDTWTMELRPIVDKKLGKLYMAFNPTFDRSFHGPGAASGFNFSPNIKVSYDVLKRAAFGVEYYGSYGTWYDWDPIRDTQQQFIPAIDLDLGKRWEFNFGVGVGVTQATDHLLIKAILGYRFGGPSEP